MPKGVFVVLTSASTPEQDTAFNDWYSNVHLGEVVQVPGIVSARRFKIASAQTADDASLGPMTPTWRSMRHDERF